MQYFRVGEVAFLVNDQLAAAARPLPDEVRLIAMADDRQFGVREMILKTYQGSLDCPEIDGVRAIDDILLGYRPTGVSGDRHWHLLRYQDRPVGCLLLGEHESHQWGLIYMGIAPESRGCGPGKMDGHLRAIVCVPARWPGDVPGGRHTESAGIAGLTAAGVPQVGTAPDFHQSPEKVSGSEGEPRSRISPAENSSTWHAVWPTAFPPARQNSHRECPGVSYRVLRRNVREFRRRRKKFGRGS